MTIPALRIASLASLATLLAGLPAGFAQSSGGGRSNQPVGVIDNRSDVLDTRMSNLSVAELEALRLAQDGRPRQKWEISKGKNHAELPPEFRWDKPPVPVDLLFPVYPFEQLRAGVAGKVRVYYIVGHEGRVINAQLDEASSPEFGLAVTAMLDSWRFKPALHEDGTPCYANLGIEYEFKPKGHGDVPVSVSAREILRDLEKRPEAIARLNELDAPLKPTARRAPSYPIALMKDGPAGEALIEFYVDKRGDAQLPRVISSSAPEFGYAAAQAVSAWRFEPPRKEKRAVNVLVRVPIEFAAMAAALRRGPGRPPGQKSGSRAEPAPPPTGRTLLPAAPVHPNGRRDGVHFLNYEYSAIASQTMENVAAGRAGRGESRPLGG